MQRLRRCLHIVNIKYCSSDKINQIWQKSRPVTHNIALRLNHDLNRFDIDETEGQQYAELAQEYLGIGCGNQRVFVLQPYIKWGRNKNHDTSPELRLSEAVALINTLQNWSVAGKKCVPLMTLQKEKLLGSGSLDDLKDQISQIGGISAVFISTNTLRHYQISNLEKELGVRVYDRYGIVIHIFRQHAKSPEAKLQVAIAEVPYISEKMWELTKYRNDRKTVNDKRRMFLHRYQEKLTTALEKMRTHRSIMKRQRVKMEYPTVAIVGYTNCGKTSLIKALTKDNNLQPENKLFATLDTTLHGGTLPCSMKVLYIDTIGFIQDVPEMLMEPFRVTLQDAIDADIIIHLYDISHPDMEAQFKHVEQTIQKMDFEDEKVIRIANKCDLVEKSKIPADVLAISAMKEIGTDTVRLQLEKLIFKATERSKLRVRVKTGCESAAWLHKETVVSKSEPDPEDAQYTIMHIIVTKHQMERFKQFLKQ